MAKDIQELFSFKTMLGLVERVKSGLPTTGLPAGLLQPTATVEGHQAIYTRVHGNRTLAAAVAYGNPSQRVEQDGIQDVPVTLMHFYEHHMHKPVTMAQLASFDNPQRQLLGEQEIARQVGRFKTRYDNTRIAAVMSAICKGYIWMDAAGNILPTSTGAAITVDFGIPVGSRTQLDIIGDGSIIDASWATAGTDILGHLKAIKTEAAKKGGWVPTIALYGDAIPGYLAANTAIQNMIHGAPSLAVTFSNNEISAGLGGFNWTPGGTFHFVDPNGATQSWLGDDDIIFMPAPDPTWYDLLQGTFSWPWPGRWLRQVQPLQYLGSAQSGKPPPHVLEGVPAHET